MASFASSATMASAGFSATVPACNRESSLSSLYSRRNSFSRNLSFSPLSVRSPVNDRSSRIVAMASEEASDPSAAVQEFLKPISDAWDKTDDKLAVGALGFAALIALWSSTGLISAIDKLPLLPSLFEFIGVIVTAWFIYRYLLFKPDREELVKNIEGTLARVTGSDGSNE